MTLLFILYCGTVVSLILITLFLSVLSYFVWTVSESKVEAVLTSTVGVAFAVITVALIYYSPFAVTLISGVK